MKFIRFLNILLLLYLAVVLTVLALDTGVVNSFWDVVDLWNSTGNPNFP